MQHVGSDDRDDVDVGRQLRENPGALGERSVRGKVAVRGPAAAVGVSFQESLERVRQPCLQLSGRHGGDRQRIRCAPRMRREAVPTARSAGRRPRTGRSFFAPSMARLPVRIFSSYRPRSEAGTSTGMGSPTVDSGIDASGPRRTQHRRREVERCVGRHAAASCRAVVREALYASPGTPMAIDWTA